MKQKKSSKLWKILSEAKREGSAPLQWNDCLSEKDREKLRGMLNKELPRDMSPLDIDTVEQQYKHKEYVQGFKIEAKCAEDVDKAKQMEAFINYAVAKGGEDMKKAITGALLHGYGIDAGKYMKKDKGTGINIPIKLIREELGYGDDSK